MTVVPRLVGYAACIIAFAQACPAVAQDANDTVPAKVGDYIIVDSGENGFEGVRHLNIAAGDGNQQANIASIATGEAAINTAAVSQLGENTSPESGRRYEAQISKDAFAGSQGLTAINIAAGSNNQQANIAMITTGLEGRVASTAILSQTRASSEPLSTNDASAQSEHIARIDPDAFRDSSGIVQVSIIGGTGNASANVAVLSMEVGTN
ncbi:hypothetical protein [uncultured Erythrobacter sp.]|uniref:hypothetical protein n=1 Tax=uncultured Erythrobacter sp. TaxID=263913 RepID=UPI002611EA33|nr:hypothetical protein [uncultured Erythrobacter sp.]